MSWKHLRGAVIKRVEHPKTRRTGVVRLDKRHMWFFARENDNDVTAEPFASKNGGEVEAWLLEQLKHTSDADSLEWMPVVEIEHGGSSKHYYRDSSKEEQQEGIDLEIKRYFIALTRDQREWRSLKWEECDPESSTCVPESERYAASRKYGMGPRSDQRSSYDTPFKLPSFSERGSSGTKIVVAFTPELWAGLLKIVQQIRIARLNIGELVGTKDGVALVGEIGAGKLPLLLAAPTETVKKARHA